jgi:hypothetical protein
MDWRKAKKPNAPSGGRSRRSPPPPRAPTGPHLVWVYKACWWRGAGLSLGAGRWAPGVNAKWSKLFRLSRLDPHRRHGVWTRAGRLLTPGVWSLERLRPLATSQSGAPFTPPPPQCGRWQWAVSRGGSSARQ